MLRRLWANVGSYWPNFTQRERSENESQPFEYRWFIARLASLFCLNGNTFAVYGRCRNKKMKRWPRRLSEAFAGSAAPLRFRSVFAA
jgi:hypothetical protein